jgi:predicted nucleic acid-binding protein
MSDEQVFFDTNVLVYANDVSSGNKQGIARKLIAASMQAGNGSISTQVLAEFWVTVTRKLAIPLDRSLAERQLALLSSFSVVAIDLGLVLSAVKIQDRYGISYWDAQIIAATTLAGCALLYSEDLLDGAEYDGIRVKNPFS